MAAVKPVLTDQQSVDIIMDSLANELQGMAWLFCKVLVDEIKELVDCTPTRHVKFTDVQQQVSVLKSILCGYTAKESAIASVIKSAAKKTAVDLNQDPQNLCSCISCKS